MEPIPASNTYDNTLKRTIIFVKQKGWVAYLIALLAIGIDELLMSLHSLKR